MSDGIVSRRALLSGAVSAGGLLLIGCSRESGEDAAAGGSNHAGTASPQKVAMTVYRDPSCGCCESWANIAREAGYEVSLIDDPDMATVKKRLGVPEDLASCHTATVNSYVVEGHVPMDDVARLLSGPASIRGIAVPGMPAGSPGMEMPDGTKQRYDVIAFAADGRTSVFSTRNA